MPAETQWAGYNTPSAQGVTQPQKQTQYDPNNIPDYGGVYGASQADAESAFQKAQASINAKRSGIFQQYGYNEDGSVNGNNPLGAYQQDRRADAQDVMQAEDDSISRGLGTTGLGAQGIEQAQYGADLRDQGIAGSYLSALQGNDQEKEDAINARSSALLAARQNEILAAIQNGWFTPGDTTQDSGPTVPDPTPQPPAGSNAAQTAARLAAATKGKKPLAPVAVKVAANKSGASANKRQGIFSIH